MPRQAQPRDSLTLEQERFVVMDVNGYNAQEIIKDLWDIDPDDPGYHAAECKLSRWRKHPMYEQRWKEEIRKYDFSDYTKARRTLRRSMDDDKDKWLAMQSAVNVMNTAGKRIFGAEENAITVQITSGMPEIGTPDTDVDSGID